MTNTKNQRKPNGSLRRAAALCLLALVAALLQARDARAQWTTSGNTTSTTNSVGVGTSTPATSLHITTSSTAIPRGVTNEQTSADGNGSLYVVRKSRGGAAVQNGDSLGNFYAEAFDGTSFVSGGRLRFVVDGAVSANNVPTSLQFFTGNNGNGGVERMRISSNGNVGIGTSAPNKNLEVAGSAPALFVGTSSATNPDANVTSRILLGSASSVSPGLFTFVSNDTLSGDGIGAMQWANYALTGTEKRLGSVGLSLDGASNSGALQFHTSNAGTLAERMRITASGNVGIGTTAPATALHVVGDVTVTGNIAAKYQDVAEWVPTLQALPAGTVVVLDTRHDNHVVASAKAYDTRVAGVVSARPGLALGEAGEGKALVATTGRVKVKVDASQGAIHVGDLLVTSDRPGLAMLSRPVEVGGVQIHRPGTIIGKALEPLDKGTGEILVLLSLQ